MPQADLSYSADLNLDAAEILAKIEAVILDHDSGAGACKGRASRSDVFHHTHLLLRVAILRKPHRDETFRSALVHDLAKLVDAYLPKGTQRAVELNFASDDYLTGPSAG